MNITSPHIVAMIPVRMDSSRLPGKGLRNLLGRPMLWYSVQRLKACKKIDMIAIVTTKQSCDDPLEKWAKEMGLGLFRGSMNNVLGRFLNAAIYFNAEIVIRANGDMPLVAFEAVEIGLEQIISGKLEFVTGKSKYTKLPVGVGPEFVTKDTLSKLDRKVEKKTDREHISSFIFDNPQEFLWMPLKNIKEYEAPHISLTVDTIDDFHRIERLMRILPNREPGDWDLETIIKAATSLGRVRSE